jgi:hypothetical protein
MAGAKGHGTRVVTSGERTLQGGLKEGLRVSPDPRDTHSLLDEAGIAREASTKLRVLRGGPGLEIRDE